MSGYYVVNFKKMSFFLFFLFFSLSPVDGYVFYNQNCSSKVIWKSSTDLKLINLSYPEWLLSNYLWTKSAINLDFHLNFLKQMSQHISGRVLQNSTTFLAEVGQPVRSFLRTSQKIRANDDFHTSCCGPRKIMTWRGQFKENRGIYAALVSGNRAWRKVVDTNPENPVVPSLYRTFRRCSRQTNSRSGCHGLLKNSKNKESLKIYSVMETTCIFCQSQLCSWNSYGLQQFLRSGAHWPKAPCWWDLITYTQCTDTAGVRCEHVLLRL